jgi:hypothetical protein
VRVTKQVREEAALLAQVFSSNPDLVYVTEVMEAFGMSQAARTLFYASSPSDAECYVFARTGDYWAISAETEARIRCAG